MPDGPDADGKLSHLDAKGRASMVDISAKSASVRRATARGRLLVARQTLERLRSGDVPKGDVLAAARIAGVMAAKQTPALIPLCHGLPLDHVAVQFAYLEQPAPGILIEATAATRAATGVEMEALTAVQVAALTLFDMLKAIDKTMIIADVHVSLKTGGRSGTHRFEHPIPGVDDEALVWL